MTGITIELQREEDGRWIAEVDAIPGALVYGATPNDAVREVEALASRIMAERALKPENQLPVKANPEVMSGVPVFAGTRVPVATLFEYLIKGSTFAEFLECFPTVPEKDALIVSRHGNHRD